MFRCCTGKERVGLKVGKCIFLRKPEKAKRDAQTARETKQTEAF